MSRIFSTPVASVYPHYVAKLERKGRTRDELDEWVLVPGRLPAQERSALSQPDRNLEAQGRSDSAST